MLKTRQTVSVILALALSLSFMGSVAWATDDHDDYKFKTLTIILDGTPKNGEEFYQNLFTRYEELANKAGFSFDCNMNIDWIYLAENPDGFENQFGPNGQEYTISPEQLFEYLKNTMAMERLETYDVIFFAKDGQNFEWWGSGDPVDTQLGAFDHGIKKNTVIVSLDPIYLGYHGFVHGAFNVVTFGWLNSQQQYDFVVEYGGVDLLTMGALKKLPPEWFTKPLDEYLVPNPRYNVNYNPYYGLVADAEMLFSLVDPKRPEDNDSCKREREVMLLNALDEWYGWREAHYRWFHHFDDKVVVTPTPTPTTPIIPSPTPPVTTLPFKDVVPEDWYYDGVKYVCDMGIMTGTETDRFEPDVALTRAMLATILYRLEGEPAVSYEAVFTDVPDGQWYTAPIMWANQIEIASGYGNGEFGTTDIITREQFVTMIQRSAVNKGIDVSGGGDIYDIFTDASAVSVWAVDAMKWAVSQGVITGTTPTTLAPGEATDRAHGAVMLDRFMRNIIGMN